MMSEHPARFLWMRYLVSELDDAQSAQLSRHLEGCPECTELVEQLRGVQKAGRQIAPELQLAPTRRSWSRWLALPIVAAAAVLLVLVLRGPKSKPPAPRPGIQAKGSSVRVSALCKIRERAWRCDSGEMLAAGASIRFELALPADRYVLILGVDATGQIQRYFPDSPRAQKLPAVEATLPPDHSLVLDDSPGDERFFVLLSDRPFDASVALFRNDRLVVRAPGTQIEQRSFLFHKGTSQITPDARSSNRTDAGATR